jgi:hypothetical protein
MTFYNIFASSNVPAIVILGGSVLIVGLIIGVAIMKSADDEDDDDCFSNDQSEKLTKHNKSIENVKEGFQAEELSEEIIEELKEEPDWNPDILIVLRTDYITAVELAKQGLVEEYIGTYPSVYTIRRLNTKSYERRKSI